MCVFIFVYSWFRDLSLALKIVQKYLMESHLPHLYMNNSDIYPPYSNSTLFTIFCLLFSWRSTWQEEIKRSFHTTFQIMSPILAANNSIMSKYNTNLIQKFLLLISRVVLSAFLTSLFISLVFIRTDLLCQYYSKSFLSDDKVHSVCYFELRWSTVPPWLSTEVCYFGPLMWHWVQLVE